ncbi:MAG: hypothetical protein ACKVPJ_03985 [Chitinophagales bacterium]
MKFFFIFSILFISHQLHAQPVVSKAQALANETIMMMGGADAFNATNYIGWNYFDYRKIIWDKENDRVRVDYLTKDITIIASLHREEGYLFMNGEEVTQPDSLKKYFDKARKILMNDGYWLMMPFKLRDKGVTLTYIGEEKSILGNDCEVIQMTFNNVGVTPENKYLIYMNKEIRLIEAWKYFAHFDDETPEIINSWGNYKLYGNILLSSDRGTEGQLSEIHVWETLPSSIFIDKKISPFAELGK